MTLYWNTIIRLLQCACFLQFEHFKLWVTHGKKFDRKKSFQKRVKKRRCSLKLLLVRYSRSVDYYRCCCQLALANTWSPLYHRNPQLTILPEKDFVIILNLSQIRTYFYFYSPIQQDLLILRIVYVFCFLILGFTFYMKILSLSNKQCSNFLDQNGKWILPIFVCLGCEGH